MINNIYLFVIDNNHFKHISYIFSWPWEQTSYVQVTESPWPGWADWYKFDRLLLMFDWFLHSHRCGFRCKIILSHRGDSVNTQPAEGVVSHPNFSSEQVDFRFEKKILFFSSYSLLSHTQVVYTFTLRYFMCRKLTRFSFF